MPLFICVQSCQRSFPSQPGLRRHQAWCAHFKAEDMAIMEGAAERIAEQDAIRKRRKLEQHAVAGTNTVCYAQLLRHTYH
jgi:hypothetical protein